MHEDHSPHHHDGPEPCRMCGQGTDRYDRHIRFTWPDPALELPEPQRTATVWLSHGTAAESVMMALPDLGSFVRVLLPLHLDDGTSLTYGAWLGVHPAEMTRAFTVWLEPAYADLHLDGFLANDIPPGGVLGAEASALVRDETHTPYLYSSTHPVLDRLLTGISPAAPHA